MNKIIGLLIVLSLIFGILLMYPTNDDSSIPDQAMRLRVLANSNDVEDQHVKRMVRNRVFAEMSQWSVQPKTLVQSRQLLHLKIPQLQMAVQETLDSLGVDDPFTIKLGMESFPRKGFRGQVIPAGEYEALVISLGEGAGNNWWCVIFPPLCLIDEPVEEDIKPRFWLWECLERWWSS